MARLQRIKFNFCYHSRFASTRCPAVESLLYVLLREFKEPKPLRQAHARVVASGLSHSIYHSNCLMNSYASCGLTDEAQNIFGQIERKNLFSWTILISGFVKNYQFDEAIDYFHDMMTCGLVPNAVTIASILPALSNLGLIQMGKSVHSYWIRQSSESNVFVETALVDMYLKFKRIDVGRKLFDNMSERNVVSWNVMISGYFDNGFGEEALLLFNIMRRHAYFMDSLTIISLIYAATSIKYLGTGVHGLTIRTGFVNDQFVRTALMDMYVNSNFVADANHIFNEMIVKDVAAWTLMLMGFSSGRYWSKAIEHFNEMMGVEELSLDSVALRGILSSCSGSGALQQGKRVHGLVLKTGFKGDIFVGSAIIDMYSNCANVQDGRKFFEEMEGKDVACWNAMISGYGMNGNGIDAVDLFLRMKDSGANPNESTMICVLCACSHAGMVDEGLQIFKHMVKLWRIIPNMKHYACVVDLLGRAGRLCQAYSLISDMPLPPDSEVYGALLSACVVHNNMELGIEVSQRLLELRPVDAGYYILLSNMYALAGNWEGVKLTRVSLQSEGLKKDPGFSSIDIDGEMHTFLAGEKDILYTLKVVKFRD